MFIHKRGYFCQDYFYRLKYIVIVMFSLRQSDTTMTLSHCKYIRIYVPYLDKQHTYLLHYIQSSFTPFKIVQNELDFLPVMQIQIHTYIISKLTHRATGTALVIRRVPDCDLYTYICCMYLPIEVIHTLSSTAGFRFLIFPCFEVLAQLIIMFSRRGRIIITRYFALSNAKGYYRLMNHRQSVVSIISAIC